MDLSGFRNEIKGEWEYVRYTGFGIPLPASPPGNGRILSFGSNNNFERKAHDSILFKGTYQLEKRKDCFGDERSIFVETTDAGFTNGYLVERRGDSLYISNPNCFSDGGTAMYRKL